MSQTTTPPNAPEVDVLAVLNLHCDCDSSEIAAGHYRAGLLCEKSAAVAALLTREAALVAEVDLLRRVQASMATEGVALVAERDALIDERDQLNSDYLTAINAANVIAAENKALREALIDVRDNVRDNSPVMWHRVDAALALGESRSDG